MTKVYVLARGISPRTPDAPGIAAYWCPYVEAVRNERALFGTSGHCSHYDKILGLGMSRKRLPAIQLPLIQFQQEDPPCTLPDSLTFFVGYQSF